MKQIAFYFYDKNLLVSRLIKYFTGRRNKSHVKIGFDYSPEGECDDYIEAIGGRFFGPSGIVASNRLATHHEGRYEPSAPPYVLTIAVSDYQYLEAKFKALNYEGGKYGYLGLLKWVLRFVSIKHQGKYCSELAAEIFNSATGLDLPTDQSPNSLYDIIRAYKHAQDFSPWK